MHKGDKTHVFILFESLDCTECRRYGTLMAQLAKSTEGSPQVARTNCALTGSQLCKAFHLNDGPFPSIRIVEERAVYEFKIPEQGSGGLQFDEVVQALESKSYKENVLNTNIETFVREGEKDA